MNSYSKAIYNYIIKKYPKCKDFNNSTDELLELAIPAPEGSNIGILFIKTTEEDLLYFRNSHPYSGYFTDTKQELSAIIQGIMKTRYCGQSEQKTING